MNHDFPNPPPACALLALLLLAVAAPTHAQTVYKCVDRDNHIAFQATPCAASQRAQRIEIVAPPPVVATAPPVAPATRQRKPRSAPRQVRAPRETPSFECRSAGGALFYRHSGCPASIPRRANGSSARADGPDRVRATRIPRSDACKRMRSAGREGREHDESVSTYERNLGRDPCRRY